MKIKKMCKNKGNLLKIKGEGRPMCWQKRPTTLRHVANELGYKKRNQIPSKYLVLPLSFFHFFLYNSKKLIFSQTFFFLQTQIKSLTQQEASCKHEQKTSLRQRGKQKSRCSGYRDRIGDGGVQTPGWTRGFVGRRGSLRWCSSSSGNRGEELAVDAAEG